MASPNQIGPVSNTQVLCPQCGYNLTGAAIGGNCPECGRDIDYSAMAQRKPSAGLAVASMVLGIIAILVSPLVVVSAVFVLVAVGLGIAALVKVSNGSASGKGMAIAGLVCSLLGVVGSVVSGVFYVWVTKQAITQAQTMQTQIMTTQRGMVNKQMQATMQQALKQQGLSPQQQALAQQALAQQFGQNGQGAPGVPNGLQTTPTPGANAVTTTPTGPGNGQGNGQGGGPQAAKIKPAPQVKMTSEVILSDKLPFPISTQEADDLEFKGLKLHSGQLFLAKPQQYPSRLVRCDSVIAPQGHRLLRIEMPYKSALKVFGESDLSSDRFQSFWLEDKNGTESYAIGYVLHRSKRNLYIHFNRDFIQVGSDLPLDKMGDKDHLYIYFAVPKGAMIESLKVGNPGSRTNPVTARQKLEMKIPAR